MAPSSDRRAALLAIVPTLLSLAIIAHHPVVRVVHPGDVAEIVAGVDRIAGWNAAFHALILLLWTTQALGLFAFADRIDPGRPLVRAGGLLMLVSLTLIFVAGTFDGFVTPVLARRCSGEACGMLFAFTFAAIQGFTRVGLGVQALALGCWSIALAVAWPRLRIVALVGLLLSLGALVALAPMQLVIDPSRLGTIASFEAAWTLGAGTVLWIGWLARSP